MGGRGGSEMVNAYDITAYDITAPICHVHDDSHQALYLLGGECGEINR